MSRPTHTIALKEPVEFNGKTYDSLTMVKPKVADQVDSYKNGMTQAEADVAMIAAICSVPVGVIRELSFADYEQLGQILRNFPLPPRTASAEAS